MTERDDSLETLKARRCELAALCAEAEERLRSTVEFYKKDFVGAADDWKTLDRIISVANQLKDIRRNIDPNHKPEFLHDPSKGKPDGAQAF